MLHYLVYTCLFFVNVCSLQIPNTPNIPKTSYSPYFNYWHCLGIYENIDFSKPYICNIGDLPLVVWKDKKNKLHTAINVCKHMGTRFDHGKITDTGCLKCPYHGLEYDVRDSIGETTLHQGRVFWSYKPKTKKPFSIPYYNNPHFETSFLQVDMPCSLPDAAFNTMDLIHPEYVHGNAFGFGNSIPPNNIEKYTYPNEDMVGMSFDYASKGVLAKNVVTLGSNYTKNFNMFHYPNFGWSKVRIPFTNNNLIIGVNFLPIEAKKTRWFITIVHNYYKSPLKKMFMRAMTASILFQDFVQIRHQYPENELKSAALFNFVFKNEPAVLHLKDIFKEKYKYPDIVDCANLYHDYKNSD